MARLIAEFGDWWGKNPMGAEEIRGSVERIMAGGDGEFLLGGGERRDGGGRRLPGALSLERLEVG